MSLHGKTWRKIAEEAEAERDQLRELLDAAYRERDANEDRAHRAEAISRTRTLDRDRYRAALEHIEKMNGGYPDDYCSIARRALTTSPQEASENP